MHVPSEDFASNEKFTIRINTFRRNDELRVTVRHYAYCSHVDSIQIIWSDLENEPPPLSFFGLNSMHAPIMFEKHKQDSLNNRFLPLSPLATDTVYSTDDDVLISCHDLELGFRVWLNSKAPMVGFSRRLHGTSEGKNVYLYKEHVHVKGRYSFVLTKNCFFDNSLMSHFNNPSLEPLRKYVDDNRNCEDILMSFVGANVTGRPPIYVYATVKDIGKKNGISTISSHKGSRNKCLDVFVKHFGRDPLISSSYEVRPVAEYALKFPGFWI
jgi:hypothetical protein